MNQKGFAPIVALVVLTLISLGVYTTNTTVRNTIISDVSKIIPSAIPSIIPATQPSSSPASTSYNFDAKVGGVEVKVLGKNGGNLDQDVLVELRTYNGVNVFGDKIKGQPTRDQDVKYVKKDEQVAVFTDVPPGRYKVSVMYGSLWKRSTDIDVISGQTVTSSINLDDFPSPTPYPTDSSSSISNQNRVTISGNYSISDIGKVLYTFSFPKNGGEIAGNINGFCNGKVTGQVTPQNENKVSDFAGQLDAKCTKTVVFSFKVDMKADLQGTVDYNKGKIGVTYIFSQPESFRGWTSLNFTP